MWTNRDRRQGKSHVEIFKSVALSTFGLDVDKLVRDRAHQFWVLGIDENDNCYRDLMGNIDLGSMETFNKEFTNTDAGFRSSVQNHLFGIVEQADVYLINTAHIAKSKFVIAPLVIHEIAHYLEQIGEASRYQPEAIDVANGQVLLDSFSPDVLKLHTATWAGLLCRAAREEVMSGRYSSVRLFLEHAVPEYDRPNWQGSMIQEPAR